ncbi:unnamed protein product [Closterium sp. NIES-65]|nr:unnamed protein product [Closterium sp. NIES-65]
MMLLLNASQDIGEGSARIARFAPQARADILLRRGYSSLRRYLRACNWHVQRAERMLRDTLKWRDQCRPEEIQWADVAEEGAKGKVYRTAFQDKHDRPVVMLSAGQQVRHLVHCLENAVMNLPATACEQQQLQLQPLPGKGECSFLGKVIRPFIDPVTFNKILFVNTSHSVRIDILLFKRLSNLSLDPFCHNK